MKSLKQEMQFSITKSVLLNGEYFKYKGQVHSPTMVQKYDPFTSIFTSSFCTPRVSNGLTLSGWQKNTYISTASLILPILFINCYKKSTFLGRCSSPDLDELLSTTQLPFWGIFPLHSYIRSTAPRLLHVPLSRTQGVCVCFA